jgi:type IV secretory pathway VirB2 component (pilin)
MKSLHSAARVKRPNLRPSLSGFLLLTLLMIPLAAHAQSSPFDTGLTSIQTLFTGTVAKASSLIAIVLGAHGIVFQDYLETVWTAQQRRDALIERISAMVGSWSLGPLVEALRGLRGIDMISAATFIASTGDLSRFESPRLLMGYLGLRCEEVAHLKWQDIDWQAGSIRICSQKSRRERILPLPEDVGKALAVYLRTFSNIPPWVFDSSRSTFPDEMRRLHIKAISKYLFKRAGVVGGSAHSLRHTVATNMVNHGASFKDVSDLLGHRRISTTLIYAKLDMKALTQVGGHATLLLARSYSVADAPRLRNEGRRCATSQTSSHGYKGVQASHQASHRPSSAAEPRRCEYLCRRADQ